MAHIISPYDRASQAPTEAPSNASKYRAYAPFRDNRGVYHSKSWVSRLTNQVANWRGASSREVAYEEIIDENEMVLDEMIASGEIQKNPIWSDLKFLGKKERFLRYLDFCSEMLDVRKFQLAQELEEGLMDQSECEVWMEVGEWGKDAIKYWKRKSGGTFVLKPNGEIWTGANN